MNACMRIAKTALSASAAALLVLSAGRAAAQEASAGASADVGMSASTSGASGHAHDNSSAFVAAGKVGGIVPFGGFKPFVSGDLELGWIFGGTHRSIGAVLDASYTTPKANGTETDKLGRVPSNGYSWDLTQKEFVLQPTFLYRFTSLGTIVPYAGVGPRIYFLETTVRGQAQNQAFGETTEKSTKFGVGVPLGAEYELGPGGLLAEVLLQWAPIDHTITGNTNLAAATIFLGYRALL